MSTASGFPGCTLPPEPRGSGGSLWSTQSRRGELCVRVCMCVCVCTRACVCMYVSVSVCVCVCVHAHVCVNVQNYYLHLIVSKLVGGWSSDSG